MVIKLKSVRLEKGLTQEELASKVGVSRQTINYIERGKYKPTILLALKISRVLEVKVEDIFQLEEGDFK